MDALLSYATWCRHIVQHKGIDAHPAPEGFSLATTESTVPHPLVAWRRFQSDFSMFVFLFRKEMMMISEASYLPRFLLDGRASLAAVPLQVYILILEVLI